MNTIHNYIKSDLQEKDDEVLNEIKRVRTELYAIAEYNHNELKLLYAAAKEEMKRLEIKRKLDMVDQEVCIIINILHCSQFVHYLIFEWFFFFISSLNSTKRYGQQNKNDDHLQSKSEVKYFVYQMNKNVYQRNWK